MISPSTLVTRALEARRKKEERELAEAEELAASQTKGLDWAFVEIVSQIANEHDMHPGELLAIASAEGNGQWHSFPGDNTLLLPSNVTIWLQFEECKPICTVFVFDKREHNYRQLEYRQGLSWRVQWGPHEQWISSWETLLAAIAEARIEFEQCQESADQESATEATRTATDDEKPPADKHCPLQLEYVPCGGRCQWYRHSGCGLIAALEAIAAKQAVINPKERNR